MSAPSVGNPRTRYPSNCMAERVLVVPCSHAQSVHMRVSGGAGLVVSFDFRDALSARIANEFLYAPACLSFDIVPGGTGPGNQPSCLLVVAAAGRVRTTTSRRARRWARGTVPPRAGEGSADARAILH
jgi:hypothetical protein